MKDRGRSNPFQFSLAWLLAYITVMALLSGGMAYGRWQAMRTYGTEEAQADWTTWRITTAVEEAYGTGPVKRKMPKSAEPPALVLMRDHFASCLALSLVLTSVLFGTFMVLIRGAMSPAAQFVDRSPPEPKKS